MELNFDFSDFNTKFKKITEQVVPELAEDGLGRAMLQLLNDCVMEVPTVPLKEGWLRGSGSIFVQNKLMGISSFGKSGKANTEHIEGINFNQLVGVIGFNTPYASKMHEGVDFHFTDPSSGAKYLESKLHRNGERYMLIIANTIKGGGNA